MRMLHQEGQYASAGGEEGLSPILSQIPDDEFEGAEGDWIDGINGMIVNDDQVWGHLDPLVTFQLWFSCIELRSVNRAFWEHWAY